MSAFTKIIVFFTLLLSSLTASVVLANQPTSVLVRSLLKSATLDHQGGLLVLTEVVQTTVISGFRKPPRPRLLLSRYNPDGSLDESFGSFQGHELILPHLHPHYFTIDFQINLNAQGEIILAGIIGKRTVRGESRPPMRMDDLEEVIELIKQAKREKENQRQLMQQQLISGFDRELMHAEMQERIKQVLELTKNIAERWEQEVREESAYLYVLKLRADGRVDHSFGKSGKGRSIFKLSTPAIHREPRAFNLTGLHIKEDGKVNIAVASYYLAADVLSQTAPSQFPFHNLNRMIFIDLDPQGALLQKTKPRLLPSQEIGQLLKEKLAYHHLTPQDLQFGKMDVGEDGLLVFSGTVVANNRDRDHAIIPFMIIINKQMRSKPILYLSKPQIINPVTDSEFFFGYTSTQIIEAKYEQPYLLATVSKASASSGSTPILIIATQDPLEHRVLVQRFQVDENMQTLSLDRSFPQKIHHGFIAPLFKSIPDAMSLRGDDVSLVLFDDTQLKYGKLKMSAKRISAKNGDLLNEGQWKIIMEPELGVCLNIFLMH